MRFSLTNLRRRVAALFDGSAWLLIAPAFFGIYLVDPAMARTLMQWSLFGVVLSGVAIIISRIVFPQFHLTALVELAEDGNMPAAILAASIVAFVAALLLALVFWAKA